MNLTLPARLRCRADRIRYPVALALSLACLSGLSFAGAAHADAPFFAPTFTAGQPVSGTDFPTQTFVANHVSAVPDPNGSGVAVLRYTVDNSDQPYPGANPRADLLTRAWYTEGSTSFTSIPVKIPTGLSPFQSSGSSFYQFAEAKDTAASIPSWGLGLMADSSGRNHWFFYATPEIGNYGALWLGPVVDGAWHTFVVAAYYTSATGRGWLELYADGQPVTFNMGKFSGHTRATGVTTILDHVGAWPLDINSYRSSGSLLGTMTMYHGAPKIGPSLASVIGAGTGTPAPAPAPPPAPGPGAAPVPGPARLPISILASPRPLKAAFTSSRHTSAIGQRVAFSAATSTGGPVGYEWAVGRHSLGTGPTLRYRFWSVGTKHLRLTVTGANGATSTVTHVHVVLRTNHRSASRATRRSHHQARHRRNRHHHHQAHHRRNRHHHRRAHHRRGHDHHRAHHRRNRHHHRRAHG